MAASRSVSPTERRVSEAGLMPTQATPISPTVRWEARPVPTSPYDRAKLRIEMSAVAPVRLPAMPFAALASAALDAAGGIRK
ncbi:MAG: hypothetical protein NVS9B3_00710 [Gemmatimonadaceae bacterium]